MSSQTSVVRLYKESVEQCYFAKCSEDEKGLEVVLLDGGKAYSFSFGFDEMDSLAKKKKLPVEELREWATEAFQVSSTNHIFAINDDGGEHEVIWQRGRGTRVRGNLGRFKLKEVDLAAAQAEVMNESLGKFSSLRQEHANLQDRHNTLLQDLKSARSKVFEFEKGKNEVEKELFEQFLPILNSKQNKIAELTKRLAKGGSSAKSPAKDDDDEDSYGSNTDVDEDAEPPSKKMASLNTSQNFLNM